MNRNVKKQPVKDNKYINKNVYVQSVLSTKIYLDITEIGKNVKQILEKKLISQVSNKCIPEGFVSPKKIKIIQYSSGTLIRNSIVYHVVYECDIAHPVEGMYLMAKTKTITKAGIHAQVIDDDDSNIIPITVFVARDHNMSSHSFHNVIEGGMIKVKVIGIRYELNDPYVCVIANIEKEHIERGQEKKEQVGGVVDTVYDEDVMDTNFDNDFLTHPV